MPKPSIDQALDRLLAKKGKQLSEIERAGLAKAFWEGGQQAILAHMGTAKEAAAAVDYARQLSATARLQLASKTTTRAAKPYHSAEWARINRILTEHKASLVQLPGVVGFGPGYRVRAGVKQPEKTAIVYVKKKLGLEELNDRLPLPQSLASVSGDAIGVDVVEFGDLELQAAGGNSIGIPNPWGTIGVFATDKESNESVALTAMHVTNLPENAPPGLNFSSPWPGLPGTMLLGSFLRGTRQETDAASIRVAGPGLASNTITQLGVIGGWRPVVDTDRGTAVWMYGASSGFCSGVLNDVHHDIPEYNLVDTLLVDIQSAHGDSGAALVDNQNLVLGLLVGVDRQTGWRIFTPIDLVLQKLVCRL